jgi:TolB-like protein/class 3 adenylate cyclase/Tfp pilus assembly protein PilF
MERVRAERRLAAILAADIVGYSRLVEANEAGTLAAIRDLRREVIDPLLSEHHGRIVKLMGDGALVEFGSVVDAVSCAVAIQKGVAAQQAEVSPERRIVFRIGINLGDVVVEGDDLLGDGVNVAARLEQLCEPGGVLISGTAHDQLKGKLDLPLEFIGEQRLKNIAEPVRAYRVRLDGVRQSRWRSLQQRGRRRLLPVLAFLLAFVLVAGATAWWFRPVDLGLTTKPSLAVLPFDNMGGDDATGRLAGGITEDIITDLARYRDMDVIARNSTAVYEGKPVDVRQVGRDLNVRYVLEGSVQRQGEQIRVTAQLLDANTGAHLWSERWDRPAADVFAVQTEVAEQVATRIGDFRGAITEAERAAARRSRPQDLTAYELYLLGREALGRMSAETTHEAIRLLTQAVEKDPKLARAWMELGAAHDLTTSFDTDPKIAQPKALDAIQRALELDPLDASAHAVLGNIVAPMGDLARAEAAFETALRLQPGSADILALYSGWASTFGKPERGAEAADRAIRLNPNYPVWAGNGFRWAYFMAGRYEDALRVLERQPLDNLTRLGWVLRAATYAALGRIDEKAATVDALKRYPDFTIEGIINDPFSEAERLRLIETMGAAGFPPCARPEDLVEFEKPVRLPECVKT